jgi:2-polyprenyl-6-methoxyphenol hydroxylase-like FAD-dependent oxidoreductase
VSGAAPALDADVAIVGFGPVGQLLTALLGRAGHRVAVIERHAEPYPLPRAIHFDHEVMRILQGVGLAAELLPRLIATDRYLWYGADGELILDLDTSALGVSGWASDYTFYQPDLEAGLIAAAQAPPGVALHRGWRAEAVDLQADSVQVELRVGREPTPGRWEPTEETRSLRARYLVGADGAGSGVRAELGMASVDLGFAEPWLVVDVTPHDLATLEELPLVAQYCDPRRPTVCVRNGPEHQRWEFMLLPGDSPQTRRAEPGAIWELLAPWIGPDRATIVRATAYTFRSRVVERMGEGRVLLAGDAAHEMPPHMGQGMCSGLRDAQNLGWKLALVLAGHAPESLLATYDAERRPHNEALIRISRQMGRISCETDPVAAAARDSALRSGALGPPPPPPRLRDGAVLGDELAGTLAVQGRVRGPHEDGLLDDVLGTAFTLLAAHCDPATLLDDEDRAYLAAIGARTASLGAGGLEDLDGRLTAWLTEANVEAVVVRPDFYVFGACADPAGVPGLVRALRTALSEPSSIPVG